MNILFFNIINKYQICFELYKIKNIRYYTVNLKITFIGCRYITQHIGRPNLKPVFCANYNNWLLQTIYIYTICIELTSGNYTDRV